MKRTNELVSRVGISNFLMKLEGLVTATRDYHGELTHLKVHPVRDGEAHPPEARTKQKVVDDIVNNDCVYYTASPDGDERITLKARLRVVKGGSKQYLRIDDKSTAKDKLPELPNF